MTPFPDDDDFFFMGLVPIPAPEHIPTNIDHPEPTLAECPQGESSSTIVDDHEH
jgi:hypothetical protein